MDSYRKYYKGKLILITGGASGLGAELAVMMESLGARVIVWDQDESGLEAFVKDHNDIKGFHVDITDVNQIHGYLEHLNHSFGEIDILINNAGIFMAGEARDLDTVRWRKCFEVNLLGMVNVISMVYPDMVTRRKGQIINISSMAGLAPLPLIIPYVASKYGIIGLTRSLRIEAGSLGVKVNLVCPGRLDTLLMEKSETVHVAGSEFISAVPFKPYPLQKAASKILAGAWRNKSLIIFPWYVHALWYTERFAHFLLIPFYSLALKKFRKLRGGKPE